MGLHCAAAFDRIVDFLDEFGAHSGCLESSLVRATDSYFIHDHAHARVPAASPVPEVPVISSQAEFEERCRGPWPCLLLLLQGDGEVHSPDLVSKVAKLYAGDRLVVLAVDVERWRAPLIQLQAQAPCALFVGPFGSESTYIANRMPDLMPGQDFSVTIRSPPS